MNRRKIVKYIALPTAIIMILSTAAFARPHYHYHYHGCGGPAWYNTGWGAAAIGLGTGLLISSIANSSRNSVRVDPGRYRQDPGRYRQDPGYYRYNYGRYSRYGYRNTEYAERVPEGVVVNGQLYTPAQTNSAYRYYGDRYNTYSYPFRQDPGR